MDERLKRIARAYEEILDALPVGDWRSSESLRDTPLRAARALLELLRGYEEPDWNAISFEEPAQYLEDNDLVVVAGIKFASLCEHHLLPIIGRAHVAYVPRGKVIGLSKIPRIVNYVSSRLQVQERLTAQIADLVEEHTGSGDVMVVTEALHMCSCIRGVRSCSPMLVVAARGIFRKDARLRNHVMELIKAYRLEVRL